MAIEIGCRPKHWSLTANVPICKNRTQMQKYADQPSAAMVESVVPPCRFIDKLDYVYEEFELEDDGIVEKSGM